MYDPEIGDADCDIPARTSFNDLSNDWVCPICGLEKDEFKIVED